MTKLTFGYADFGPKFGKIIKDEIPYFHKNQMFTRYETNATEHYFGILGMETVNNINPIVPMTSRAGNIKKLNTNFAA